MRTRAEKVDGGTYVCLLQLIDTHLQCTKMGMSETLASLTWWSMWIREVGYFGTVKSGQPVKR